MDIVDQIKEANSIEDVIEEMFPLQRKHGRYLRAREHDSLVIDTMTQTYSWNSKNEIRGDVIEWLMQRQGWDFKTTIEWLARRANLPEPKWSKEESEQRIARRDREDVFAVAQGVMQRWLGDDEEAIGYCRGRGWTEETIRESGVCFSGRGAASEFEDMRGEFAMHEIDVQCPNAAAVLGFRGDVKEWGLKWNVEPYENWVEWGFIPGLMGKTRLVYAHSVNGRVRTYAARNILGAEINKEGKEVKSYNLPVVLAGKRQAYFNHVYRARSEECVILEGQADAITLAQWGIAGVALAGTSWHDHEYLLKELRKRHKKLYVGMDADEAGLQALQGRDKDFPMAQVLGAMTRLVGWGMEEK